MSAGPFCVDRSRPRPRSRGFACGASYRNPSPRWGAPFEKGSLVQSQLHVICAETLGTQWPLRCKCTPSAFGSSPLRERDHCILCVAGAPSLRLSPTHDDLRVASLLQIMFAGAKCVRCHPGGGTKKHAALSGVACELIS